jgi:hypothetical protein
MFRGLHTMAQGRFFGYFNARFYLRPRSQRSFQPGTRSPALAEEIGGTGLVAPQNCS